MGIGRKIAKLRQEKNLTQKSLAERAGISESYLSRIEEENCPRPHMKALSRIADALRAEVRELYDEN